MFKNAKLAQDIFPMHACRSLAIWFLDQFIDRMPLINVGGLNEKSWSVAQQISEEQKKSFVKNFSESFFEQMKDILLIAGQSRNFPISISKVADYAKNAGFPEICLPKENLLKPIAYLMSEGKIAVDDGFINDFIYDCNRFIPYQSSHFKESLKIPNITAGSLLNNRKWQ